jgi:hypothetical protein
LLCERGRPRTRRAALKSFLRERNWTLVSILLALFAGGLIVFVVGFITRVVS